MKLLTTSQHRYFQLMIYTCDSTTKSYQLGVCVNTDTYWLRHKFCICVDLIFITFQINISKKH